MADSVVPFTREVAIDQMRLLARNLPTWKQPASFEDLVVQG